MKQENQNVEVNIDLSPVLGSVIAKVIKFYNIETNEEEVMKLSDEILKDEKILNALKSLIK